MRLAIMLACSKEAREPASGRWRANAARVTAGQRRSRRRSRPRRVRAMDDASVPAQLATVSTDEPLDVTDASTEEPPLTLSNLPHDELTCIAASLLDGDAEAIYALARFAYCTSKALSSSFAHLPALVAQHAARRWQDHEMTTTFVLESYALRAAVTASGCHRITFEDAKLELAAGALV